MASRKKSISQSAPATQTEARAKLNRYRQIQNTLDENRRVAAVRIDEISAALHTANAPLEAEAKATFLEMRSWWAVSGDEVTGGKAKSAIMAGCLIGTRFTTPALKSPTGMSANAAVTALRNLGLGYTDGAIRVKETLDKPAILKLLANKPYSLPVQAMVDLGFGVVQRNEFFIDTAADKTPATQNIDADVAITEIKKEPKS